MWKETFSEECRLEESRRMRCNNPDHIPVLVGPWRRTDPPIQKFKYLVPKELTVGQFMWVLRKRIELHSNQSIFLLCSGHMTTPTRLMHDVDVSHRDEHDGFLYMNYALENTFG